MESYVTKYARSRGITEEEALTHNIVKEYKKEKKMIDIKPCPFCGGKAKVKKTPWDRSEEGSSVCEVYCTECHASIYGETFNFYQVKYDSDNPQDKISAIEKWNRRKINKAPADYRQRTLHK